MTNLPRITKLEAEAISLLQEYLDGADYSDEAEWSIPEKRALFFDIGFQRFAAEDFWYDYDTEQRNQYVLAQRERIRQYKAMK